MNKCKFCGKDSLVWKEIVILNNNHVWRPFKDGKLHDCRGVWDGEGDLLAKCKFCGEDGLVWKDVPQETWRLFIYRGPSHEAVTLHKCPKGSEDGDEDTGYDDDSEESISDCMDDICENCSGDGCSECGGIDPDPGTDVTRYY